MSLKICYKDPLLVKIFKFEKNFPEILVILSNFILTATRKLTPNLSNFQHMNYFFSFRSNYSHPL